jgi:hypothetical protein
MNTYTAMAGKAALDLVVPMALEVGKNLANKAGKGILSRTRQLNKPRKEANTGIIPHISGAPTAVGTRFQASKPRFNTRGQTVTLSHREMLTSINMTSSPSVTNEPFINPFNPYIFPWLATIAGSYDRFQISSLVLEYVPTCATTQTGQIIMAWDPQASDAIVDYHDLSLMRSVCFSPWLPATLPVPASVVKYMGEQVSLGSDVAKDMYSHGSFYVGTNGADTNLVGTLFVSYVVHLLDPQPSTGLSSVNNITAPGSATNFTALTAVDGFNAFTVGTAGLMVPIGTWKVEVYYVGTGLGAAATFTLGSGVTSTSTITATNSGGTTNVSYTFLKSNGGNTASFTSKINYTTATTLQLRITRVDPNSFIAASVVV